MKHKNLLFKLCCLLLIISLLPISILAADKPPSSAGSRKLEGGKRDFKWPVPNQYLLSSCYLDGRDHYSLDIAAPMGREVVASYAGVVVDIFKGCDHNWGKRSECCSSWGNYVLLEHSYTLLSGKKITLYSRYAHLGRITVKVGDKVLRGQKVGEVGSTGYSTGPHLDYDILYGGTASRYSIDPYINDLLELPDGVYTRYYSCCRSYLSYVKKTYAKCLHTGYNSDGCCTECGYRFDWDATKDTSTMGYYHVLTDTTAYTVPYKQTSGTPLQAGQRFAVASTVVNGRDEIWYEFATPDGQMVYVPVSDLEFEIHYPSVIKISSCTVTNGVALPQASFRLDGQINSRYPLRQVVGYLDGKKYATWSGDGNDTQLGLRGTNLNKKLNFADLSPGEHTLILRATDSTGQESQIYTCTFLIEKTAIIYTVTFQGLEDGKIILPEGKPLGELPTMDRAGYKFLGWSTEDGELVSKDTIPEADMTLTAQWEPLIYTVNLEGVDREYAHGDTIEADSIPVKDGYDFGGWIADDGRDIPLGTPVYQPMNLQAQWLARRYTITLDAAGGELKEDTPKVVVFGAEYGTVPTPYRTGYLFRGWQLNGENVDAHTVFSTPTDVTLVAVWEINPTVVWTWVLVGLVVLGGAGAAVYFLVLKKKTPTAVG